MEYKTKMAPEMKSDNSIVTQADKAIEAFLDEAFTDEANNVFVIGEAGYRHPAQVIEKRIIVKDDPHLLTMQGIFNG